MLKKFFAPSDITGGYLICLSRAYTLTVSDRIEFLSRVREADSGNSERCRYDGKNAGILSGLVEPIPSLPPRSCDVDPEIPVLELLAVQLVDGCLSLIVRRHLHETETLRSARLSISNYLHRFNFTKLFKNLSQVFIDHIVRYISHVYVHQRSSFRMRTEPGSSLIHRARLNVGFHIYYYVHK